MLDSLLAIIAGIVTVASPCTLPLLPIVFALAAQGNHPKRPYAIVAGFVLIKTFSVFLIAIAGSVLGIETTTWRLIAAIFFGLFGIITLSSSLSTTLFGSLKNALSRIDTSKYLLNGDLFSAFIGGGLLAIIWAPCAGPALGSIGILIASKKHLLRGLWLLFLFALGVGLPMLLIAQSGKKATSYLQQHPKLIPTIQRVFGVFLLLIALMLITGFDTQIQYWILDTAPQWYRTGNWRL